MIFELLDVDDAFGFGTCPLCSGLRLTGVSEFLAAARPRGWRAGSTVPRKRTVMRVRGWAAAWTTNLGGCPDLWGPAVTNVPERPFVDISRRLDFSHVISGVQRGLAGGV
jgi:hypothetical protein